MIAKKSTTSAVVPFLLLSATFAASAASDESSGTQQRVPPSLLACSVEPDSLQRLVCYDREIKRLSVETSAPTPAAAPAPAAALARAAAPAPAAAAAPAAPAAAAPAAAPLARPEEARHIKARVERVTVDRDDLLTVYLDNRQIWKQARESSAQLHIKPGDTISIDKEMGVYYLADRLGTAVRVLRIGP